MSRFRMPRLLVTTAFLTTLATAGLSPIHAQSALYAVVDSALGVGLTSIPAGWTTAPPGQYTAGTLDFVTTVNGEKDIRFAIAPLGLTDTSNEAAVSSMAADALVQGLALRITRQPTQVAGSAGTMLLGMPGEGPNVQIVVAHGGALYNLIAFGSPTLQPDQQQALGSLRFLPRIGTFPPTHPSSPQGTHETRSLPQLPQVAGSGNMYIFWGASVNHSSCNSGLLAGGDLQTGDISGQLNPCYGFFYNQGDHKGLNDPLHTNDLYAIDWDEALGNSVFAQCYCTATVSYAGSSSDGYMGYGNWVVLNDGNGLYSYYAHLEDISVYRNQQATLSTVVGHSGCTGNCGNVPHVHVAWVLNPNTDSSGRPYGGTAQPQSPLYTFTQYNPYNSLTAGEVVHGV